MSKKCPLYPELKAEMAKKGISILDIANDPRINRTNSTMNQKLNGKSPILLDEAFIIKDLLKSDLSIEELFKKSVTE